MMAFLLCISILNAHTRSTFCLVQVLPLSLSTPVSGFSKRCFDDCWPQTISLVLRPEGSASQLPLLSDQKRFACVITGAANRVSDHLL